MAHKQKLVRPPIFKTCGEALTVKGRQIICKGTNSAGSAIINEEVSSGTVIVEFRIVQCKQASDESDLFFGVVKTNEVGNEDYWCDEDFQDKAW